jgi:hypothetical protein
MPLKTVAIIPIPKLKNITTIKYTVGTCQAVLERVYIGDGANGPTIFFIGLTFSLFAVSTARRMPGRPSILCALLNAQYL